MFSEVAAQCVANGFFLAVSNPRFELWLILHFVDIPSESPQQHQQRLENPNTNLCPELDQCLKHRKGNSYIECCFPHTETAIARARQLDIHPKERWPTRLGTRVYLLMKRILWHNKETFCST